MGTPREPIRLVDERGTIRLLTVKTGVDHTASMTAYSAQKGDGARRRGPLRLRPEEGLPELRHDPRQGLQRQGAGASASASASSRRRCSRASRTCRSKKRDASPIRGCARISSNAYSPIGGFAICSRRAGRVGDLVRFHTAHKLVLLAHSTQAYTRLGRARRRRQVGRPRRAARRLHGRLHGRAGEDRDAGAPHQRAAAHGRLLQEIAGRRLARRAAVARSRTTAAGSSRSSSRSPCSVITCAFTTWRTSRVRSISRLTRKS